MAIWTRLLFANKEKKLDQEKSWEHRDFFPVFLLGIMKGHLKSLRAILARC